MARLTSTLVGAAVALSSVTRAFSGGMKIANTVQADTKTTVSVDLQDSPGGYVVYLATTPPGWGTGPACLLANYTDSSVTSLDLKIPASVAPDMTTLSLSYSVFDSREDWESGGGGFSYSNDFDLEGGTGEWSKLELDGWTAFAADYTPCTAVQCTRDCGKKYYPTGEFDTDDEEGDINTYKTYYNCLAACPGTAYPPFDEMVDEGGDDPTASAGAPSASGSGTASRTAPVTASAATASATKVSSVPHTTMSSATATAASSSSSAAASSTSPAEANAASRAGLASTAILALCFGMLIWM